MANQTQIVNLSLSWLGQRLIQNLNDNQNEAIVMKANYDLTRDKVLNDHAWTFAIRRQQLAPDATQPAFGEGNRFLIPSDVIWVHRVFRPNATLQTNDLQSARWVREGRYILAREEIVWAQFIIRETNTDIYSASFVHAFAARLAADTAITFTENNRLQLKMEGLYEEKLGQAAFADGRQGRTEVQKSTILTGARTR